jgi:hypothetical protein
VHEYALIDPPHHPTYDLYQVVKLAFEEDAGDFGDITTLSTYVHCRDENFVFETLHE